jgi:hypothetical protein
MSTGSLHNMQIISAVCQQHTPLSQQLVLKEAHKRWWVNPKHIVKITQPDVRTGRLGRHKAAANQFCNTNAHLHYYMYAHWLWFAKLWQLGRAPHFLFKPLVRHVYAHQSKCILAAFVPIHDPPDQLSLFGVHRCVSEAQ